MEIEIYSDGSATTKDKPGGWAYVLVINGNKSEEGSGSVPGATNNDMELEAAIQGLAAATKYLLFKTQEVGIGLIDKSDSVTLISDSEIVLGWASGKYRFKQIDKIRKYEQLKRLVRAMDIQTRWVEGHSGVEHNERCDELANAARLREAERSRDIVNILEVDDRKEDILSIYSSDFLRQT